MKRQDKICVAAWKSLYVTPQSEAGMCCVQYPLPSKITPQTDIANVRSQKNWDRIRKSMLKGEEHPSCKRCWDKEREGNVQSYRQIFNERYPYEYNRIRNAHSKKLIDDDLAIIDIRQTNTCNMKCLSCNPVYSSMWGAEEGVNHSLRYSDQTEYTNTLKKNGVLCVENDDLEEYILDNMLSVQDIYFAGGEPMVNPLHWKILKRLDSLRKYDVRIYYNTNLLKLDYKGQHVFDYWDKFKNIFVGCSIDAIGVRAEYVRTGTHWPTVNRHLKQMKHRYPQQLDIDTTVSAINIGGLRELMVYCDNAGIRQRWSNTVTKPEHLRVDVLPREYRRHIYDEIETLVVEKLTHETNTTVKETLQSNLDHFRIAMLDTDAPSEYRKRFKQFIESKDIMRGTDIFSACPEFKDLWSKI